MKRCSVFLSTMFVCMLVLSPDARAEIQYVTYEDMNPPTTTACNAYKNLNQACRSCEPQYNDAGQQIGVVCAFVKSNGACACKKTSPCETTTSRCTYW